MRGLAFDLISISALSFFIVWIYQVVLERLNVSIQWFGESHNRATVLSLVSMLYNLSLAFLNVVWGYMVDWNMTVTLVLIGSITIGLALFSRVEESYLLD